MGSAVSIDPDFLNSLPPEVFRALQARAKAIAGTDVDPTVERITDMLGQDDDSKRARNESLAKLADDGRAAFTFNHPNGDLRTMRLLDLMLVGLLVHEHIDELFPPS